MGGDGTQGKTRKWCMSKKEPELFWIIVPFSRAENQKVAMGFLQILGKGDERPQVVFLHWFVVIYTKEDCKTAMLGKGNAQCSESWNRTGIQTVPAACIKQYGQTFEKDIWQHGSKAIKSTFILTLGLHLDVSFLRKLSKNMEKLFAQRWRWKLFS